MRCAIAMLLAVAWLWPGPAAAKKAKEKYFVTVTGVEAAEGIPAEVTAKVKDKLAALIAAREEFVPSLDGAPDPKSEPEPFKKYLKKKALRAFDVVAKVTAYEHEVLPARAGRTGQVLKVHLAVSLIGTSVPEGQLALGGDGMATVATEVGKTVRARDEEFALESTLDQALGEAITQAVDKLRTTKAATPQKK